VNSSSTQLTIVRLHIHSPAHEALYDLETLARLANVHPALVAQYIELGLLDPVKIEARTAGDLNDSSLLILRRIQRLRVDLGVNINGVAVILELQRQLDELELEVTRLHRV